MAQAALHFFVPAASAVPSCWLPGGVVSDGGATMRAGCRFQQTLTLNSPQPAQKGYLYAYPRIARPATSYFIDPKLRLS